jgi:hypothetical protein
MHLFCYQHFRYLTVYRLVYWDRNEVTCLYRYYGVLGIIYKDFVQL